MELGLELYWQAFVELNTCRSASIDGALPIPFTAIVEYGRIFDFEGEQFSDLLFIVRRMDDVYLEHGRKNREKK